MTDKGWRNVAYLAVSLAVLLVVLLIGLELQHRAEYERVMNQRDITEPIE